MTAIPSMPIDHIPADESRAQPVNPIQNPNPGQPTTSTQSVDPAKPAGPIIQTQDLEYQSRPEARVSNSGVKVAPRSDDKDSIDRRAIDKESQDAARESSDAAEELDRQYREQPPS